MSKDFYYTLSAPSESIFKEKGSKFLGFAYPVSDEESIKQYLAGLRKKYFDATHHCYAYILGENQEKMKANDDGEPAHTAGTPILGQIRAKSLTDTLVVVVRYFGGTKLGTSGLIQAYKQTAFQTLAAATVLQKWITVKISVLFPYEQMNDVMRLAKRLELQLERQIATETHYQVDFLVRKSLKDEILAKFQEIRCVSIVTV